MSKKLEIRPVHLVFIGLTIIILGILIPSFFINAFSTIGLAVIIGSFILLSAYAFFAVNLVKSKGKKAIRWVLLPLILALLIYGGLFAYNKYNQYLADKIYAVGETVKIGSFNFNIAKVSEEALPFSTQGVDMNLLDCDGINYDHNIRGGLQYGNYANPYDFSEHSSCDRYNSEREQSNKYVANYDSRMTVNYQVEASDKMQGKDLQIKVLPDSGRAIALNSGIEGEQYSLVWRLNKDYVANPASDFGGDLNKGLTRKGTVSFDLQKTEQTIDVVVKYHNQSRTIRINR